jgi:hypothetical protein
MFRYSASTKACWSEVRRISIMTHSINASTSTCTHYHYTPYADHDHLFRIRRHYIWSVLIVIFSNEIHSNVNIHSSFRSHSQAFIQNCHEHIHLKFRSNLDKFSTRKTSLLVLTRNSSDAMDLSICNGPVDLQCTVSTKGWLSKDPKVDQKFDRSLY